MVGAKQLETLGLSWFRPGPYVQQRRARGTILLCTGVPVVGRLQARRERRRGLQVPGEVFEAVGDVVGELRSVCVMWFRMFVRRCPLRRVGSPSFYRPRRGRFTGVPHCLAIGRGMACITGESAAVLTVLATILSSWRVLYPNSGGFEGRGVAVDRGVFRRARGSRRRRSVRDTVAGVAASCPACLTAPEWLQQCPV
jgi:hypothetical protein